MRKPRVFVASSTESLDVADAINVNLEYLAEVTLWRNSFQLSSSSIDSLVEKSKVMDFAVFIFTPDDVITIRDQSKFTVRDNVLFELGLFIGTLGKERCFIVKPRGVNLHFPTDLLGLTPTDYEGERSDGDLISAVNYSCVLIRKQIEVVGLIELDVEVQKQKRKKPLYEFSLGDVEHLVLANILENHASSPEGIAVWHTFGNLKQLGGGELAVAAIKLERLGYISKGIESNLDGEYYTFAMTPDGIDYVLENEDLLRQANSCGLTSGFRSNDDIPF